MLKNLINIAIIIEIIIRNEYNDDKKTMEMFNKKYIKVV